MDDSSNWMASGVAGTFILLYLCFIAALIAFSIWLWWRILAKAGYNGALSLLILTGIGGLIIQLILAFGKWPIENELEALRGSPRPVAPTIGGPPMTT